MPVKEALGTEQAQKLMRTPEGKQLYAQLTRQGGDTLQKAGEALRRGDTQQVEALMAPLLQDAEVQRLLAALEKAMGHG
jgi:hypothetical protein